MLRSVRDRVLPYSLTVISLVALWEFASHNINPVFFPTPTSVWQSFLSLATRDLWFHASVSLARIITGFLFGTFVGIPIGLVMGGIPFLRKALHGVVDFFRFIPPIAMIVLAVVWFGTGEKAKVFLIWFATVFMVIINTEDGVSHVNRNRIRAAQTMGATAWQVFRYVIFPSALPQVFTGMRVAMASAFSTIVASEMIVAEHGIGYLLHNARLFLQTPAIYVSIVMLGILGFITDRVFRILIERFGGEYAVVR